MFNKKIHSPAEEYDLFIKHVKQLRNEHIPQEWHIKTAMFRDFAT